MVVEMKLVLLIAYCMAVLLFLAEFWSHIAGSRKAGYLAGVIFLMAAVGFAFFMVWAFPPQ